MWSSISLSAVHVDNEEEKKSLVSSETAAELTVNVERKPHNNCRFSLTGEKPMSVLVLSVSRGSYSKCAVDEAD